MGVDLVSRPDMPEIISYFKGESDTSEAIDEELRASTLIKKTSREEVKEERRAAARETLERPLCTKESILQTPNVSYKYLLTYCNESVKNRKRQRESSNLSFLEEVLKLPHKSQDIPPHPIILVPSNPSPGNLCLYNALQFLDKGIYMEDIQDYAVMQPVMFTRKVRDKIVNFEIYDQTLTFNKNHWRRVAAVFVQGPRYQFKDWPLGNDLVQLFLSVRGFYMKYHDVPADENVKKWNVKQLLINRNKRHMDRTIQNEFWAEFEKFLFSPRYNKSSLYISRIQDEL